MTNEREVYRSLCRIALAAPAVSDPLGGYINMACPRVELVQRMELDQQFAQIIARALGTEQETDLTERVWQDTLSDISAYRAVLEERDRCMRLP